MVPAIAAHDADPVTWMRDRQDALRAAFASNVDARPIVAEMLDTSPTGLAAFQPLWAGLGVEGRAEVVVNLGRVIENRYCELARTMSVTYDEIRSESVPEGEVVSVRYIDETTGPTVIRHMLSRVGGSWRVREQEAFGVGTIESVAASLVGRVETDGASSVRAHVAELAAHDTWPPGVPDSCAPRP